MTIGQRIEQVRITQDIPIYQICDIMCMTESEYNNIANHGATTPVFNIAMLICNTNNPRPFAAVL